jgi:ribosomal protein S19
VSGDGVTVLLCFLSLAIGLIIGIGVGSDYQEDRICHDAIKHGVGEYYLTTDHEKEFRWKPPLK